VHVRARTRRAQDYVGTDHNTAMIGFNTVFMASLLLLSLMRAFDKFNGSLHHIGFSFVYSCLFFGTLITSVLAYGYNMTVLSKFEPLYATSSSFKMLRHDSLPTASLILTTIAAVATFSFSFVTVPSADAFRESMLLHVNGLAANLAGP